MRKLNLFDRLIGELDQSLRTVHTLAPTTEREYPPQVSGLEKPADEKLSDSQRKLSSSLMRINHAGEVSAQGLYRGQSLTAKRDDIREQMECSAMEENDHLNWCEKRISELNGHTSFFNPVWYWGSFSLGALAGLAGDKWSLGFVKETEDQVVKHLENHMKELPANDLPSIAILQKMKADEMHHADVAVQSGSAKLPLVIRKVIMPLTSKIMTGISARL